MACACEKDRGRGNKCAHCKEGNHKACSYTESAPDRLLNLRVTEFDQ